MANADTDETPAAVLERVSNALVQSGYFPSDPTRPFVLNVLHVGTNLDDVFGAVAPLQETCEAEQCPLVCCSNHPHVYLVVSSGDVTWKRVQGGPAHRPALITCVV